MAKELRKNGRKETVFVGLSGGVDSSVSAALLKKEGYDVIGVFLKVWQPPFLTCTWPEERQDAMRVAAHLHIPFLTFDFEKEYKRDVVDYMIAEYKKGWVPNPDVMCNRSIKFGLFFQKARAMGADYVATGHYARVKERSKGTHSLLVGVDKNKDQSYFLWTLSQKELQRILFPVGGYKKAEVRKLARMFALPTAEKKDSQGLCFMGKVDMREFLAHYISEIPGNVHDSEGNTIGRHQGAHFYTIGQRHGFTITEKNIASAPHYVVAKDIKKNTITVAPREIEKNFGKKDIVLRNPHWIESPPKEGKRYSARIRYRGQLIPCEIKRKKRALHIIFKTSQLMAPGQSLVLYDKEFCLGGGIMGTN